MPKTFLIQILFCFQNYTFAVTMSSDYVTMVYDGNKARPIYIDRDLKQSFTAKTGMAIRTPYTQPDMSTPAFLATSKSVPVNPLPVSMVIPTPVITAWPGGAAEEYAAILGWRYTDTTPQEFTVSYLIDIKDVGMSSFRIIVGGSPKTENFPFSMLLGMEGRIAGAAGSMISVTIDPAEIIFPPNKMVSSWGPITEVFRGSMSHAGVDHDWKTGPGVYVRYTTRVNIDQY